MATHLYRESKLGDSLVEALDILVDDGKIPGQLALRILAEYDEAITAALEKLNSKATFKGQLDVYRFCDNVWNFVLSNVQIRLSPSSSSSKRDEEELNVERLRMVLVDSKLAGGNPNP
ncbi:hypothetical protein N2152v2_002594 [Parachlorella kessleri]